MSDLTAKRFQDEATARKHLEGVRWPDGPICPHCGGVDHAHRIKGRSARAGLWFCADCRQQFTVTVGTLFERSKIPLHKWLLAVHLLNASKKGISSHQLHRMLGVTYKTAWFMSHRIREAMRDSDPGPLGGEGKTVEVDETYVTRVPTKDVFVSGEGWKRVKDRAAIRKHRNTEKIVALVERDGRARSFHVERVNAKTLRPILVQQISRKSRLMTDDAKCYARVGHEFSGHETVNHSIEEYVRGEAHTNTIEGYFSIFKRGMTGVYQHCGSQHLKRYLCEFDFRYNERRVTDAERADKALKGIAGKRLTYRRTYEAANA